MLALSVTLSLVRPWRVLARQVLFSRPPWIEAGVENVELPDGRVIDEFPWIRTRDFAIVVALTPERMVILERSYKHGPRRVALSLPAGYVNEGETPDRTASRELREETGYVSDDWTALGSFTVDGNYGVCTEHVFLARTAYRRGDAGGAGHDDLEEIEVLSVSLDDAITALMDGRVAQLASAAALALAVVALSNER